MASSRREPPMLRNGPRPPSKLKRAESRLWACGAAAVTKSGKWSLVKQVVRQAWQEPNGRIAARERRNLAKQGENERCARLICLGPRTIKLNGKTPHLPVRLCRLLTTQDESLTCIPSRYRSKKTKGRLFRAQLRILHRQVGRQDAIR